MIDIYGLFLILLAIFMLGGVLFVKINEMNKLLGTRETVTFIAVIFLIGIVFMTLRICEMGFTKVLFVSTQNVKAIKVFEQKY
jgi:hypothetical protein